MVLAPGAAVAAGSELATGGERCAALLGELLPAEEAAEGPEAVVVARYQVGATRVYFRPGVLEQLNTALQDKLDAYRQPANSA